MTAGEKLAAWLIGAFAAITRVVAMSSTPWDADEGLFMSALRHYDVVAHHPHPPGFPLFIALAKPLTFLGEFRALQLLALIASIAIVPATLFAGRALGYTARASLMAAALLAFFPNVWYFGGTAFSDVPSMTLSLVAIALLLRGQLMGAAVVVGIAAGIRPQTLLIAAVPAVMAFTRVRWQRAIAFVLIVAVIVLASYGVAAHLSGGWASYRQSLADHETYIASHDSFRAPLRPPMWELFDNFFIRPYDAPLINILISALVAVSIVRWRERVVLLATFAPFCLAAWALLDRFSTSRFSIGYAPLFAFLAADGIELMARRYAPLAAAAVVAVMIVWTWPALVVVHRTVSPPVAAAGYVQHRNLKAYVADEMGPIFDALLPNTPHVDLPPGLPPLTGAMREGDVYVREGASASPGAVVFRRQGGHLAAIARSTRYFEVSIVPVRQAMQFAEGWYRPEISWRWMSGRGRIVLPPHLARMRLTLALYVPLDALPAPPLVAVTFNGVPLDRIQATEANLERTYDVVAPLDKPSEVIIETGETVNPSRRGLPDSRDLGVRLNEITWSAR